MIAPGSGSSWSHASDVRRHWGRNAKSDRRSESAGWSEAVAVALQFPREFNNIPSFFCEIWQCPQRWSCVSVKVPFSTVQRYLGEMEELTWPKVCEENNLSWYWYFETKKMNMFLKVNSFQQELQDLGQLVHDFCWSVITGDYSSLRWSNLWNGHIWCHMAWWFICWFSWKELRAELQSLERDGDVPQEDEARSTFEAKKCEKQRDPKK